MKTLPLQLVQRHLFGLNNIDCKKENVKGELIMTKRVLVQLEWLHDALLREGLVKDGERSRKERCLLQDYNAPIAFIAGMKAVLGENYDPRQTERPFAKNCKWKPLNKYKNGANPKGKDKFRS